MIERPRTGSTRLQARHSRRVVERPCSERTRCLSQLESPGRTQLESGLPLVSSSGGAGGVLDPIRVLSGCFDRRRIVFGRRCAGRAVEAAAKTHRRSIFRGATA